MIARLFAWEDVSKHEVSLESIKKLHQPNGHFRITQDAYSGDAHFCGTMSLAHTYYVLEGEISFTVNGDKTTLTSGLAAEFPACDYWCDVPPGRGVKFVRVCLLPQQFGN